MLITTTNEWELADKSGLVSVGSYSLYVQTSGPIRKPGAPVVVFITGGGAPTETYVRLQRMIASSARNYFYDRAGYGRSERPDPHRNDGNDSGLAITSSGACGRRLLGSSDASGTNGKKIWATDSATELHTLMRAIGVLPPYVLAAHSYGGIIARTYYSLYAQDVAGMALLDTASELMQQCWGSIPPAVFSKVVADVDFEELTHLREESGMTDGEWKAAEDAVLRTMPTADDEETHGSGRALARRRQIDRCVMLSKPLLVLRSNMAGDFRIMFEEGVRKGGGTDEERRQAE